MEEKKIQSSGDKNTIYEELKSEKFLININNSYYIEYINYLNNIYFNYDNIIISEFLLNEEIKILININENVLTYNILTNFKNENKKKKNRNKNKNKKKKKNQNKSIEQLYDIFNNKIKNFIKYKPFLEPDTKNIKNIINKNINEYKNIYKDDINKYIYISSINIYNEIEEYIEKNIYHEINFFNKALRNVFVNYKVFALLVKKDISKDEKVKWKFKIEKYIFETLKNLN